tara:strand:+ start:8367 stop:9143 length:777 start_codon:yes stop_codon:yes gene_type:complete
MDIWNNIPYRDQRRLAHLRSLFLKNSGIRKRENKRRKELIKSNHELKEEKRILEESFPIKVKQKVDEYVIDARKMMKEHEIVTKEIVTSALTKRDPELSEAIKARYIPNSVVLPMVINTLAAVDRRFRKSPLAIYSNGESIYTGNNFSRISKLGTLEVKALIEEHTSELSELEWDKPYVVENDKFDLYFHKFIVHGIKDGEDMNNIGVYAVPKAKEKKRVGKLMKNLGSSTIERIQKAYGKMMTPEVEYGYGVAHETV